MKFSNLILMLITIFYVNLIPQDKITIGKKAPDFVLKEIDGSNYRLSDNLGKGPIVMNFWATWCIPCIEELKQLKRIYKIYTEMEVEFLAVSVDDPKTVGRVHSFVRSKKYPFKILLDTNNDVMHLYQSNVPPYTVVIDQNGDVVFSHAGYRMGDEKRLEEEINNLLQAKKEKREEK
jgi:peroxiredoxin